MISKIFVVASSLLLVVVGLASCSGFGYGHSNGYGGRHGNLHGHGQQYGRASYGGPIDYKFGYAVNQGDYHSKAKFEHYQDPHRFEYNVYQTHPHGGQSKIYRQQYQKSGYGHY